MRPLRFIHCADLHLDRPFEGLQEVPSFLFDRIRESTFQSLRRIIDAAVENEVDFIIIAGDLYDGANRSLRAQVRFREEMKRLESRRIEAYVIHGNHDHLGGDWVRLEWPGNVHFFGSEVEVLPYAKNGETLAYLYGFSYGQRAVTENMSEHYVKKDGAPYHIGLLHGYSKGAKEHDQYAPFTVSELVSKGLDYWALGHIHNKQHLHQDPAVLYPGNIQGLHKKETGEKGCFFVELNGNETSLSFIPTAEIEWDAVHIGISDIVSFDSLLYQCGSQLDSLRKQTNPVLATITFSGAGSLHHDLLQEGQVDDLLATLRESEEAETPFVWPVSCKVETRPNWNRETLKEERHFIGDLLRLMDEEKGNSEALEPLLYHRKANRYLSMFDGQEQKSIIKDAETLLLTELLRD